MLTFEWDSEAEQLEIHADANGLNDLVSQLLKLAAHSEIDHIHLMTEDWGGDELSSDKQNQGAELVHHVKVFKWESE
ncbi:Imm32 family immunity protein [Marinobacter fonticola]|uniref:Imm32 family immunity protein n=1 Tax=Marinobacter fonticola TaxID=2603215 RepID=UPI0011E87703